MSLYEGIKDVITVVRKADNVDLVLKLLDLEQQALDMQAEIERLCTENAELKKAKDNSERIVRHKDPVITLKDDADGLYYCAQCWDSENKLIQLTIDVEDYAYYCQHCSAHGFLDGHKLNMNISY